MQQTLSFQAEPAQFPLTLYVCLNLSLIVLDRLADDIYGWQGQPQFTQLMELPLAPAIKRMLGSPAAFVGYSGSAVAGVGRFQTASRDSAVAAELSVQALEVCLGPATGRKLQ